MNKDTTLSIEVEESHWIFLDTSSNIYDLNRDFRKLSDYFRIRDNLRDLIKDAFRVATSNGKLLTINPDALVSHIVFNVVGGCDEPYKPSEVKKSSSDELVIGNKYGYKQPYRSYLQTVIYEGYSCNRHIFRSYDGGGALYLTNLDVKSYIWQN